MGKATAANSQDAAILLPASVRLFAPEFSRPLGASVAQCLGAALGSIEEREYEGGEYKTRPLEPVRNCDAFVIASLHGDETASANDKLCRLLFFIGALRDAGASRVTACVPYLCYARKDRRTQPHDPIATRYVAALFEAVGADCVVSIDVHNEAAFDNAFRCTTVRIEGADIFADPLGEAVEMSKCVVAAPDIGGVKRAQRLRDALSAAHGTHVGFAFMEKRRLGGLVSGDAFVGDVAGSDVVIYDDMIVSGETIARTTRAARNAGARRIVVAAAHPVFTPDAMQLFATNEGPDLVLVSDTVALPASFEAQRVTKLRVCSSAGLLARTIRALTARR